MKLFDANSAQISYAEAADELARLVLDALHGVEDKPPIAQYVDMLPDATTALAAIRLLGADTFSPAILNGASFTASEAGTIANSLRAFMPAPHQPISVFTNAWIEAWRDWATKQILAHLRSGYERVPFPDTRPLAIEDNDWQSWSVRMAQLSPLALPGLESPVHDLVRHCVLPLSRGATRSMLRRDHKTSARLLRWLAWLAYEGIELPLDPAIALDHITLLGSSGPRTAMDITIAKALLQQDRGAQGRILG